ncbi:hypothetical protein D3C86_1934190 [compost metagenome]
MGDHEARSPLHEHAHRLLDVLLGARVDGARRLVEHENRGVGENRPRDREQLPLALTQVAASGGQLGVIAARQLANEPVRVSQLRGGFDFFVRRVKTAEADIFSDGIRE